MDGPLKGSGGVTSAPTLTQDVRRNRRRRNGWIAAAVLLAAAVLAAIAAVALWPDASTDPPERTAVTATPSPSASTPAPTVAGMRITYLPDIPGLARQVSVGGGGGPGWESLVASWTAGSSDRKEVTVIVYFGKAVRDLESFVAAVYPGTTPRPEGRVHGRPAVFTDDPRAGSGSTSLGWIKRPGVAVTVAVRGTGERAGQELRKIAEGVQGEPAL